MKRLLTVLLLAITAVGVGGSAAQADGPRGLTQGWAPDPYDDPSLRVAASQDLTGRLPGAPGNYHRFSAFVYQEMEVLTASITHYDCPGGTWDVRACELLEGHWGDFLDSPEPGYQKVGVLGVNISADLSHGGYDPFHVELSLRPDSPLTYSVRSFGRGQELTEMWDTQDVRMTGAIAGFDVNGGAVVASGGWADDRNTFIWTSGSEPERTAPPTERERTAPQTEQERTAPPTERGWTRAPGGSADNGFTWRRQGGLPGRPGNVHTGFVTAALDNDETSPTALVQGEWNDWYCPDGVTPPAFARRDSGCTLLRTDDGIERRLPVTNRGWKWFTTKGRLSTAILDKTGSWTSTAAVDLRLRATGTAEKTHRLLEVGVRATDYIYPSSIAAGRFGDLDLAADGLNFRGSIYSDTKIWVRTP